LGQNIIRPNEKGDFGEINIDAKLIVLVEGETVSPAGGDLTPLVEPRIVGQDLRRRRNVRRRAR
jgi:hypothetical protein